MGKSRPCHKCLQLLKTVGIRKVYYTTGIGDELVCEYVKDMVSIECSSSTIMYNTLPTNCSLLHTKKNNICNNCNISLHPNKNTSEHNILNYNTSLQISCNIICDRQSTSITSMLYFEKLLQNIFPINIKYENLLYFIEYNYNDVFLNCNYSYLIKNNKVFFYNNYKKIITTSIIYA